MAHGMIAPRGCLVANIAAAVVILEVCLFQVGPICVGIVALTARERHRFAIRGGILLVG